MTTAPSVPTSDARTFRQRLLDGLAASIIDAGYRNTTVADIVRRARTSRRTFYEHFSGKEECFVALLNDKNTETIRQITEAVDQRTPWTSQVRQAIGAWIACAESTPALTVSWIREVPALGPSARQLQRDMMEAYVEMIRRLCDSDEWRAAGGAHVPRPLAILLLGGLRELMATTVEDGGRVSDITEMAVHAVTALLAPGVVAATSGPAGADPAG